MLAIDGQDLENVLIAVVVPLLIAGVIAFAKLLVRMRDMQHDLSRGADSLEAVNQAVNHVPAGEPKLYQLVQQISDKHDRTHEAVVLLSGRFDEHVVNDQVSFGQLNSRLDGLVVGRQRGDVAQGPVET